MSTEIGHTGPAPAPIQGVERSEAPARDGADARAPEAAPARRPREAEAPEAVDDRSRALLEELVQGELRPNARLSIDKADSGVIVYKILDSETGEVYRQWPREEMLRIMSYFREIAGLVVDRSI
jgi:uncharacterized FlaG/YvyC family protein